MSEIRYGHTNLIATDWRRLVQFYGEVFCCRPVGTERDLQGESLERGTGLAGARLRGVHLRLPGYGDSGPTLEIFSYEQNLPNAAPAWPNRVGFGHIAFVVADVEATRRAVLAAGGSQHGEVVTTAANGRKVTWVYMRDPEGNLVELQAWSD